MTVRAHTARWFSIITLSYLGLSFLTPMVVHADGGAPNRAYIAGATKGIGIISISQQKVIDHLAVTGDPHAILLSLDGNYLYVTQPQLKRVAVLIAGTGKTFCTAPVPGHPTLLALDLGAHLLFAASNDASSVTSIDPEHCKIKQIFHVNKPVYSIGIATVAASLSPNSGNQLWIADGTELTIFDDIKGTQIKQVPLPDGPQYICIPPGSTVYVTTQQNSVIAVDLTTSKAMTLISSSSYGPMDFDENTGEIYVPDQKNQQLVVLQPVNPGFALPQEPLRTIPLEAKPVSVAVTSDGQLALVALEGGKVVMLDIPARQIINTFDVGGNPHSIITGLNPPLLIPTPQQAHTLQTVLTDGAYIIVAILFVVILIALRRGAKAHSGASTAWGRLFRQKRNQKTP